MQITRTSILSGITRTRDLPIDPTNYALWASGHLLIQNAFPNLSAADREFLMTGISDEEWDALYGDDEEENLDAL